MAFLRPQATDSHFPFQGWPLARLGWGGIGLGVSVGAHLVLLGLPLSAPDAAPDSALDQPRAAVENAEDVETIAVAVLPQPQPETIPATPALPPAVSPPPQLAPTAPLAAAQPVAAPEPVATEAPLASPEFPKPESESPEPLPPEPPAPYADFPHLSGAESACPEVGHCWRSPVSSWRSAASSLQQNLEAQGYTLDNITGEVLPIDTGVRVYAVNRSGETAYYLNLVSVAEGILYSMTPTPITTADVMALQAF